MATKVQRMCLWHMLATSQSVLYFTGHKSTTVGHIENGRFRAITCSECVLFGLTSNKWIEKDIEATHEYARSAYKITPAGIKAAGKREPVMRVKSRGAHGIRWA
jgi:hypothetical protein